MKEQSHVRLASKAAGDDVTLTRYVRVRHSVGKARKHNPRIPGLMLPFMERGETKFPTRRMRVDQMTDLLVSGHSNVKIGRDVRKGRLKGYWIYTLSFEERATCPRSCGHWQDCYGNNMPFAKRVDHTDPRMLPRLEKELKRLCAKKKGVLIRLHALGDFYSSEYVAFWDRMLRTYPNLSIFGYTAWPSGTAIGWSVNELNEAWGLRSMVRLSNGRRQRMATVSIASVEACPKDAFVCPEQTEKTRCCATCGACWSTDKNVAFLAH